MEANVCSLCICTGGKYIHFEGAGVTNKSLLQNRVEHLKLLNYPPVCPEEVERVNDSIFCRKHKIMAEQMGLPSSKSKIREGLTTGMLHLQGTKGLN